MNFYLVWSFHFYKQFYKSENIISLIIEKYNLFFHIIIVQFIFSFVNCVFTEHFALNCFFYYYVCSKFFIVMDSELLVMYVLSIFHLFI